MGAMATGVNLFLPCMLATGSNGLHHPGALVGASGNKVHNRVLTLCLVESKIIQWSLS